MLTEIAVRQNAVVVSEKDNGGSLQHVHYRDESVRRISALEPGDVSVGPLIPELDDILRFIATIKTQGKRPHRTGQFWHFRVVTPI